jgi:peptidyl-prolyl cis-trans isomerase B (cyclophilin B)
VRAAALALGLALLAAGCGGGGSNESSREGCEDVGAPAPKKPAARSRPTQTLKPAFTYVLRLETSCGNFEITLDPKQSPHATASLVVLAKSAYFDGTKFHRVVPGFVIQGGDPTGSGTGGPGYSTVDPPPRDAAYTRGVVAMAKTGTDPPGTAGSQFFVVTAVDAQLPPDYAIVGEVTEGYDTVERIEALGDVQTEEPSQPVVLERVTVRTS